MILRIFFCLTSVGAFHLTFVFDKSGSMGPNYPSEDEFMATTRQSRIDSNREGDLSRAFLMGLKLMKDLRKDKYFKQIYDVDKLGQVLFDKSISEESQLYQKLIIWAERNKGYFASDCVDPFKSLPKGKVRCKEANGGGTECPENGMKALLKGIEISDRGGFIIYVSDATAGDHALHFSVTMKAKQKDIRIYMLLSGTCSDVRDKRLNDNSFNETMSPSFETGGVALLSKNLDHTTLSKFIRVTVNASLLAHLEYSKNAKEEFTQCVNEGKSRCRKGFELNTEIWIDPFIEKFAVIVLDTEASVELTSDDDELDLISLLDIQHGPIQRYKVFYCEGKDVRPGKFNLQAWTYYPRSPIRIWAQRGVSFRFDFVSKTDRSKSLKPLTNAAMIINATRSDPPIEPTMQMKVNLTTIKLVDPVTNEVLAYKTTPAKDKENTFVSEELTIPDRPFRIVTEGTVSNGSGKEFPFRRVLPGLINPVLSPCKPNPCSNGGKCRATDRQHYTCQPCNDGWQGQNCRTPTVPVYPPSKCNGSVLCAGGSLCGCPQELDEDEDSDSCFQRQCLCPQCNVLEDNACKIKPNCPCQVGEKCAQKSECVNGMCQCVGEFKLYPGLGCKLPPVTQRDAPLKTKCDSTAVCGGGSECQSDEACRCKGNVDPKNNRCQNSANPGDDCSRAQKCIKASFCDGKKCICSQNQVLENGMCKLLPDENGCGASRLCARKAKCSETGTCKCVAPMKKVKEFCNNERLSPCSLDDDCEEGFNCIGGKCDCSRPTVFYDDKGKCMLPPSKRECSRELECGGWSKCIRGTCSCIPPTKESGVKCLIIPGFGSCFSNDMCMGNTQCTDNICTCPTGKVAYMGEEDCKIPPTSTSSSTTASGNTTKCNEDKDCGGGSRCVDGKCKCRKPERPNKNNICSLNCGTDMDCPIGFKCKDERCRCNVPFVFFDEGCLIPPMSREECTDDSMCGGGSECADHGKCVCSVGKIPDGHFCLVSPPQECKIDKNCIRGAVCEKGRCKCVKGKELYGFSCKIVPGGSCNTTFDCGGDSYCLQSVCTCASPKVPKGTLCDLPGGCLLNADCLPGELCNNGTCMCPPSFHSYSTQCAKRPKETCSPKERCGGGSVCTDACLDNVKLNCSFCLCKAPKVVDLNGLSCKIAGQPASRMKELLLGGGGPEANPVPSSVPKNIPKGYRCKKDSDCVSHAFCFSGACFCKAKYKLYPEQNNYCLVPPCTTGDCSSQPTCVAQRDCGGGSMCDKDEHCRCQSSRDVFNGTHCGTGTTCTRDSDCKKTGAKCLGGKCVCAAGQHEYNDGCAKKPGDSCNDKDRCGGGSVCQGGKCSCTAPMTVDINKMFCKSTVLPMRDFVAKSGESGGGNGGDDSEGGSNAGQSGGKTGDGAGGQDSSGGGKQGAASGNGGDDGSNVDGNTGTKCKMNCTKSGAKCIDGNCVCDIGQYKYSDGCAKKPGESCYDKERCGGGSACQDGTCSCVAPMTVDINNPFCKVPKTSCNQDSDCKVAGTTCRRAKCVCSTGEHEYSDGCAKKLGVTCSGGDRCGGGSTCKDRMCSCEAPSIGDSTKTFCEAGPSNGKTGGGGASANDDNGIGNGKQSGAGANPVGNAGDGSGEDDKCKLDTDCVQNSACVSGECVCNDAYYPYPEMGNLCLAPPCGLKDCRQAAACSSNIQCGGGSTCASKDKRCHCKQDQYLNATHCGVKTSDGKVKAPTGYPMCKGDFDCGESEEICIRGVCLCTPGANCTCESDADCGANSICTKSTKQCSCPKSHEVWSKDEKSCKACAGCPCKSDIDCMDQGKCENGTCSCSYPFEMYPEKKCLIPPGRSTCYKDSECGGSSICETGMCSCGRVRSMFGKQCQYYHGQYGCMGNFDCGGRSICNEKEKATLGFGQCRCPFPLAPYIPFCNVLPRVDYVDIEEFFCNSTDDCGGGSKCVNGSSKKSATCDCTTPTQVVFGDDLYMEVYCTTPPSLCKAIQCDFYQGKVCGWLRTPESKSPDLVSWYPDSQSLKQLFPFKYIDGYDPTDLDMVDKLYEPISYSGKSFLGNPNDGYFMAVQVPHTQKWGLLEFTFPEEASVTMLLNFTYFLSSSNAVLRVMLNAPTPDSKEYGKGHTAYSSTDVMDETDQSLYKTWRRGVAVIYKGTNRVFFTAQSRQNGYITIGLDNLELLYPDSEILPTAYSPYRDGNGKLLRPC